MLSVPCSTEGPQPKPIAQTLFLGASVSSFNANMGWGGQPSTVSITLVEDKGCEGIPQITSTTSYEPNHYYTCTGDNCYIDERGNAFNAYSTPKPKEKLIPGKVYYKFDEQHGFASEYLRTGDPGFFGTATTLGAAGDPPVPVSYDIIGTPVYFKMQDFAFAGLVQSWEREVSSGGATYRVSIEGPDNILNNSWIIIGDYSGAVFTKAQSSTVLYGGPVNSSTNDMSGLGTLSQGAIPNVFNVYGFLESCGVDNFGAAKINDNGLKAKDIKDALLVLTSSYRSDDGLDQLDQLNKNRFSPFGRILVKSIQKESDLSRISTINSYGVIPPFPDRNGQLRCQCVLDLDELPDVPDDFRISGSVISIMDFVRQITDEAGYDFYWEMIPIMAFDNSTQVISVIKLHTVSRRFQPATHMIKDTIAAYEANGIPISTGSLGKENNPSNIRSLLFGPPIQRLYQTKSYRLAYTQSNYIFDSVLNQFVNYHALPGNLLGKIRFPTGYSQRNPYVSETMNGSENHSLLNMSEEIRPTGQRFNSDDTAYDDPWGSTNTIKHGNYGPTENINPSPAGSQTRPARFIPLYEDVICPFFGYQNEENIEMSTGSDSNVFRRIRPVWFDTWTGQIIVAMYVSELPITSVPLRSLFTAGSFFSIGESEIRAAMSGPEAYLIYCLEKIFKPDLFLMLLAAYKTAGSPISETFGSWQQQANAAGSTGIPDEPRPDQPDLAGSSFDVFLHPNFLRDFDILTSFVANLGQKYYGKKYMVRMPGVRAYKDQQYFDITAPANSSPFFVYQGSGKIFYNYEPCSEAWEEPQNYIDDTIAVGSSDYFTLANDNACIPPIVGYNASDNFDRTRFFLSTLPNINAFIGALGRNAGDKDGKLHQDLLVQWQAAKAGGINRPLSDFTLPSLDISSLSASEYIVKPVAAHPDAFGNTLPEAVCKKLYVKTTSEEGFAFLYPETMRGPRVIIDAPGIQLASSSLSYETDPSSTIIANVSIEDLGIYYKATQENGGTIDVPFVKYMLSYCAPIFNGAFLRGNPHNISSLYPSLQPKAAHPFFAAIPVKSKIFSYGPWTNYPYLIREEIFPTHNVSAASNGVENLIGGVKVEYDQDLAPWNYGNMSLLDRVAVKKIQAMANYQPVGEMGSIQTPGLPIFGIGSRFISRTAQTYGSLPTSQTIHNNVLYTRSSSSTAVYTDEKASGSPLPEIVSRMFGGNIVNPPNPTTQTSLTYNLLTLTAPDEQLAPIITSISISFGRDITTTYGFRTHTRKLALFNKADTDRTKEFALQNIKRNKQIANTYNSSLKTINEQKDNIRKGIGSGKGYANQANLSQKRKKFYDWSPSVLFIGGSVPFIHNQFIREIQESSNETASDARQNDENKPGKPTVPENGISLRYGADPGDDATKAAKFNDDAKTIATLYETHRRKTFVGTYTPADAKTELGHEYASKSVMSVDGLFSPVSFYPTWAGSTSHMSVYNPEQCPFCNGDQKLNVNIYNYKTRESSQANFKCQHCGVQSVPKGSSKTQLKKSAESLPPYIVASGTDISSLLSLNESSSTTQSSSDSDSSSSSGSEEGVEIPINLFSLQPIVVPYGLFRNPNASVESRCRHSIQVVGRGAEPPKNDMGFNINSNLGDYYLTNGNKQKPNEQGQGHNIDFYEYDIAGNPNRLMNHRFFGLRGPITLHGWGYDTEGYPVPNAADEPVEFDSNGRPKRFLVTITRTAKTYAQLEEGDVFEFPVDNTANKYIKRSKPIVVNDNGAFREITDEDNVTLYETENDPDNPGLFEAGANQTLGDIIGIGWSVENGKWIKKKSNKFYKDWAERSDLWPVGPIDLRWDENRRVWSVSTSDVSTTYKFVYVTLEEDLIKDDYTDTTYVARAFLDDVEYSAEPLQQNYRRLVFVQDKAGYTAPRGAKLLCRYDSNTGFYEPITKPSYIVYGIINSGNQATLEMSYVQGKRRGENNPTMLTNFDNPFGFRTIVGNKGMFNFTAGRWILSATKES
jgi:hypothetical protein